MLKKITVLAGTLLVLFSTVAAGPSSFYDEVLLSVIVTRANFDGVYGGEILAYYPDAVLFNLKDKIKKSDGKFILDPDNRKASWIATKRNSDDKFVLKPSTLAHKLENLLEDSGIELTGLSYRGEDEEIELSSLRKSSQALFFSEDKKDGSSNDDPPASVIVEIGSPELIQAKHQTMINSLLVIYQEHYRTLPLTLSIFIKQPGRAEAMAGEEPIQDVYLVSHVLDPENRAGALVIPVPGDEAIVIPTHHLQVSEIEDKHSDSSNVLSGASSWTFKIPMEPVINELIVPELFEEEYGGVTPKLECVVSDSDQENRQLGCEVIGDNKEKDGFVVISGSLATSDYAITGEDSSQVNFWLQPEDDKTTYYRIQLGVGNFQESQQGEQQIPRPPSRGPQQAPTEGPRRTSAIYPEHVVPAGAVEIIPPGMFVDEDGVELIPPGIPVDKDGVELIPPGVPVGAATKKQRLFHNSDYRVVVYYTR